MSKREPVAELGAEDYRIVKFTHDVELAEQLMRAELAREHSSPEWLDSNEEPSVGRPRLEWVRITPCLPNSYGAFEGWRFVYTYAKGPGRGAFPAVVFS